MKKMTTTHIDPFVQAFDGRKKICSGINILAGERCPVCGREGKNPQPGDGVTVSVGSDRYAGTIDKVSKSGKTIWFRYDNSRRIDNNGAFSESQTYEYEENFDAPLRQASRRKDGRYRQKGQDWGSVTIGVRNAYRDPHF